MNYLTDNIVLLYISKWLKGVRNTYLIYGLKLI